MFIHVPNHSFVDLRKVDNIEEMANYLFMHGAMLARTTHSYQYWLELCTELSTLTKVSVR